MATAVGWQARLGTSDVSSFEIVSPIMLVINWQIGEFQILFLAILLVCLVTADLLVQLRMDQVCRNLKRSLRELGLGRFEQGTVIREFLDRLNV
jgi:hypothetical protein